MAERVGIDPSFLADVELGKRNVSILNVELMVQGPQGLAFAIVFAGLRTSAIDCK